MPKPDPTIVPPRPEKMLSLLKSVSGDSYLVEHFYPRLLEYAGQPLVPLGMASMLIQESDQYITADCAGDPAAKLYVNRLMRKFVDVLVDDKEYRKAVLAHFKRCGVDI